MLRIGAKAEQRFGGEVDARAEGDRGKRSTDLMGDHRQLEMAEFGTPEPLGHHCSLPPHFGRALPEVRREGLVALEYFPTRRERRMFCEVVASGLLQELLVIGKIEIHAWDLRGSADYSRHDS